jgi:hypothetical protein
MTFTVEELERVVALTGISPFGTWLHARVYLEDPNPPEGGLPTHELQYDWTIPIEVIQGGQEEIVAHLAIARRAALGKLTDAANKAVEDGGCYRGDKWVPVSKDLRLWEAPSE